MRRALLLIGCLGFLVAAVPAQAAVPATFHIRGLITDRAGRPLPGTGVWDGSQGVYADQTGHYDFPEISPGQYTIEAQRLDTDLQTQNVYVLVPEDRTADFVLGYRGYVFQERSYLGPAGPASSDVMTVETWAPGSASSDPDAPCITVTDTRTSATLAATFDHFNGDAQRLGERFMQAPRFRARDERAMKRDPEDLPDANQAPKEGA